MPNKNHIELQPEKPGDRIGDIKLANDALQVLKKHYPGYLWRVHINNNNPVGMMDIYNLTVNEYIFGNDEWGFRIRLDRVYQDPTLKCVMRAGGEILERANMVRGWYNGDIPIFIDGVPLKNQPLETQKKIVEERLKAFDAVHKELLMKNATNLITDN